MNWSHKNIQDTHKNEIFLSLKDTLWLWVEEMKRQISNIFQTTNPSQSTISPAVKQLGKKWQLPAELDKREDNIAKMRV